MNTKINGKPDVWTDDILRLWHTHVCPKFAPGETCSEANYFTPRPYVDEWNRGSNKAGFVYTVQPGNRVGLVEWPVTLNLQVKR